MHALSRGLCESVACYQAVHALVMRSSTSIGVGRGFDPFMSAAVLSMRAALPFIGDLVIGRKERSTLGRCPR